MKKKREKEKKVYTQALGGNKVGHMLARTRGEPRLFLGKEMAGRDLSEEENNEDGFKLLLAKEMTGQ